MAYIVCGMIVKNEKDLIRYSVGSLYNFVDFFVIVDGGSEDSTVDLIKELDVDNKIKIIVNKQNTQMFDYATQRNIYLDYIKKNIYPNHKRDLYYYRADADEVAFEDWLKNLRIAIDENPDKEAFRGNFNSFTADMNSLDEKHPVESRVSVFKYVPDIRYFNKLHEIPVHSSTGIPLYGDPQNDPRLGTMYLHKVQYNHYAWCNVQRCFQKAKVYTAHYVAQGTETKDHLDNMTASKDSFWWDKKSSIKYKGKLPEVFSRIGLLPGQENPETEENSKPKISVYTIAKNVLSQDYPIKEAINSILPFADEVILNIGKSNDGTEGYLHKLYDGIEKVKMTTREWAGREKGTAFLRDESNWAKNQCKNTINLYLQADEAFHPKDFDKILDAAKTLEERKDLFAAVFNYYHFDGSYTKVNPDSYQKEVRMTKQGYNIYSIGDAQSFGINGQNIMAAKENLLETDIYCYHYGWVRSPEKMLFKLQSFDSFYHSDEEMLRMHGNDKEKFPDGKYNYGTRDRHINFDQTHPYVMYPRIKKYEKENPEWCDKNAKFDV